MEATININTYDPTRTTVLRNTFARDMGSRFKELISIIIKAIVEENVFGQVVTYQLTTPGQQAFSFSSSSDKISSFQRWLQLQEEKGLLLTGELSELGIQAENAWTNKYILDSYKRGVMRARYEMNKAGFGIPTIEETGGIYISMANPIHLDQIGLLYTRTFNDLKGITSTMDSQISRVLAQGLADGDGARLLARKIVSTINGKGVGELGITDTLGRFIPARRRAEMLARTEIVRTHHQATINEYRAWGAEGVVVKAEFITAGDARVCEECQDLERHGIYTLNEAQNLIPVHPGCRCIVLPYRPSKDLRIRI